MNGPQRRFSLIGAGLTARCPASLPLLLSIIAALALDGCSIFSPPRIKPTVDVTGFWEGRAIGACIPQVGRCGMVLISLDMIQNDSDVTGTYRCANGSIMCRNHITNGRIVVGTMSGAGLSARVMFEDVSSCIFDGRFTDIQGGGTFICMQGAGMVDRGFWQVKRAYGPEPWTG
jgi:hypothetical protein